MFMTSPERQYCCLQVVALVKVAESLLGLGHDHAGGVHLDQVLQLLLVLAHGQLPLHARHDLLVSQVRLLATALQKIILIFLSKNIFKRSKIFLNLQKYFLTYIANKYL